VKMIDYAIGYYKTFGWNLIPTRKDKKPFIPWQTYQKLKVNESTLRKWWAKYPDAGIGCITGMISNLAVIDIDSEKGLANIQKILPENIKYPVSKTPSGGKHFFFNCPDNKIGNNAKKIEGCDFRANGGYVILPPSCGANGNKYQWEFKPSEYPLINLPKEYIYTITSSSAHLNNSATNSNRPQQTATDILVKGQRDQDLFYIASCLFDGKMNPQKIEKVLILLALSCKPPFPLKDALVKVKSVLNRAEHRENNWQGEVEKWIEQQTGNWIVSDCYRDLGAVTISNKAAIRVAIGRMKSKSLIVAHHSKAGCYKRLEVATEAIDFLNASDETVDLKLPLKLNDFFIPMRRNIILIAGSPDAGKTAFLLNVVEMNMEKFRINYFSSEMGPQEFRLRLSKFARPLDSWKFNPRERSSDFSEIIEPNQINIIDYLEIHEEHYKIGRLIKDIFDRLDKGLCFIAIQRKPGATMGVGGIATLEKPRLVVNMGAGKAKITKCKQWATETNPNGLETGFKLVQGCKFLPDGDAISSPADFEWSKE